MTGRFLSTIFLWSSFLPLAHAMSCLVMRPGYGLVSEECPAAAVGCRIRAKKDHIEWYELSRLYDRNQLVCVYPEEYKSLTGCMRKPSGSIRCWCGGRPDCNDPEISRDLYEAYTEGDNESVEEISEWLKRIDGPPRRKNKTPSLPTPSTTPTPAPTTRRTTLRVTPRTTTRRTTTTSITTTRKPSTSTTTTTTTTAAKTTSKATTTTTHRPAVYNFEDNSIERRPSKLPTEALVLDNSFEETRKKLEAEMNEEGRRIKEMLADEENELSDDGGEDDDNDDDVGGDQPLTAEDQRRREREQYRMERRKAEERRVQEDDILQRIEDEERRQAVREERERRQRRLQTRENSSRPSGLAHVFWTPLLAMLVLLAKFA